jgi:hypothetical protein
MSTDKKNYSGKHLILPNNDPLGIKNITLGGAPPSFFVEAMVAEREWKMKNEKRSQKDKNK